MWNKKYHYRHFQLSDPLQFNTFLFDIDLLTSLKNYNVHKLRHFFLNTGQATVIFYGLEHMYVSEQCK